MIQRLKISYPLSRVKDTLERKKKMSNFHKWLNPTNWTGKDQRQVQAETHYKDMEEKYPTEIDLCVAKTTTYTPKRLEECFLSQSIKPVNTDPILEKATTNGALFNHYDKVLQTTQSEGHFSCDKKIALLNFASYKNAGGAFLKGAMAQEEALCHSSTLYNILSRFEDSYYAENRNNLNRGLYTDKALYTPNVIFFDKEDNEFTADVITCASPNNSIAETYGEAKFSHGENEEVLAQRIQFVRDICLAEKVDTVILGAWGCGVFRQDPFFVATEFRKAFENMGIECIYAIPDDKNYEAFKSAFYEYDKTLGQPVKTETEIEVER